MSPRLADIVGGCLLRQTRFALGFVRLALYGHRAGLRRFSLLLQYLRLRALLTVFQKKYDCRKGEQAQRKN